MKTFSNRYRMFDTPHKALRLAFGQLTHVAAKTDFTDKNDVYKLYTLTTEVFKMIHSHSYHEDNLIFPAIEVQLTEHDRTEHDRLHEEMARLEMDISNILAQVKAGGDLTLEGLYFYDNICELHKQFLQHMIEEERDTVPIFWEKMTDETLHGFEKQIVASLTPEMSALWFRFILPTQTPKQRLMFLGNVKQTAPAEAFDGLMRIAEKALDPREFAALEYAFLETAVV